MALVICSYGICACWSSLDVDLIIVILCVFVITVEEYARVAFQVEDGHYVLSFQVVGRMCRFQDLIQQSEEYQYLCEKDGHRHCCPSWSLPNYVAEYANKTDCMELKVTNIARDGMVFF